MPLKIMSQNVMCWGVEGKSSLELRRPLMKRAVKQNAPDLIGFQEVTPKWKDFFDTDLAEYKNYLVYRSQTSPEGTPIYWNDLRVQMLESGHFWLSETPDKPIKGWDAECVRITCWARFRDRTDNGEFVFINTHLDHKGEKARTEGIKQIAVFAKHNFDGMPIILTGDFNDTPDSMTLCTARQFFTDASDCAPGINNISTFHGMGECAPMTIDYILLSPNIKCLDFSLVDIHENNVMHSDHYGITAKIEL